MTPETIDLLKRESKKISRMPVAKVNIAWAGSSVDLVRLGDVGTVDSFDRLTKSENRVSIADQVISGIGNQKRWAFCETVEGSESFVTLDDDICVMPDNEEDANSRGLLVGWWGTVIAAPNPEFYNNPGYFFGENGSLRQRLQLHFPPMTISRFRLHGYYPDEEKKEWPVNFRVQAFTGYNSTPGPVVNVTGNTDVNYTGEFPTPVTNVTQLEFTIYSWSHAGGFIKVTAAVMDNFDREYTSDDILSMSILEETDGEIGALPFGNISCNSLNLTLQNLTNLYFYGNESSPYSSLLRSNRRIEPSVGFKLTDKNGLLLKDGDGKDVELYAPKGVFWSGDWSVPDQGTGASTTALDRLGLLQNVEYTGVGHFGNEDPDWKPESVLLYDKSPSEVLEWLLDDLRKSYMPDLVYHIDTDLVRRSIPLVYFPRMSYFEILKLIAQFAQAYIYMDVPDDEERGIAAKIGIDCKDILRVKSMSHFLIPDTFPDTEPVTNDDIITKTTQARAADLVNSVFVNYKPMRPNDNGIPEPVPDSGGTVSVKDAESILNYGMSRYQLKDNHLIQERDTADDMAKDILLAFNKTRRVGELDVMGDVTSSIGDVWEISDYNKGNQDVCGYYAVNRISTEYDGALRQSVSCRMIGGDKEIYKIRINITSNAIQEAIDISNENYVFVNDRRIDFDGDFFEFVGYGGTYDYKAYICGVPAVYGSFDLGGQA